MTLRTAAFILLLSIAFVTGCYYDHNDELYPTDVLTTCDTSANITYNGFVKDLMTTRCGSAQTGCHQGVGSTSAVDLSDYTSVSTAADGDMMAAVHQSGSVPPMPLNGGKLSDCNIAALQKWIDHGKPE